MDEDAFELLHHVFEVAAFGRGEHQFGRVLPRRPRRFIAIEINSVAAAV
jgi:hypothetical protein